MARSSNSVGSAQYDFSVNLPGLRASLRQADSLVEQSYKKQQAAAKKAVAPQSGTGGSSAQVAQQRINEVQREAQAAADSISKYSPQIQRQFLAVERANNQVFNATQRSSQAILKYGADSVQAQRATNSLNVALQNQVQAQGRLDSSLSGTSASLNKSSVAANGLRAAVIAAGAAIAVNLGRGVSRLDTLENFPRVATNLGASLEDGRFAIEALSQELRGLPTSLDAGAQAVQRFTAVNKDIRASTALFLGFNNAVIAGGASTQLQETAIEQLSQAYSRGKFELNEWRALLVAMPAQLDQVARSMGYVSESQLYAALQEGKVNIDDFLLSIARLNTEGANGFRSFRDQAMDAVGGVGTSITNLQTAIARSIEGALSAIGTDNIKTIIGAIATAFENFGRGVSAAINVVQYLGPATIAAAAGVTALGGAMISTSKATGVANKALLLFTNALNVIRRHPVIFAISAVVGGLTAIGSAVGLVNRNTKDTAKVSEELKESLDNFTPPLRAATDQAGDLAKQMAKIAQQAAKIQEDYRYSLAELVAQKNENIASLLSTLSEEKRAYDNAFNERKTSFDKSQNDELRSHQEKTNALEKQIDFLTRYNTAANRKQLSELQFALARENAEYQKSTQLRQAEFDAQTKSASNEYEKRRAENQKKLDAELALLEKHREDVLSIRNVMLRDEIENLKYRRDEQLKALREQEQQIRSSGSAIQQVAQQTASAWDGVIARFDRLATQSSTFAGNLLQAANNATTLQNTANSSAFQNASKNLQGASVAQLLQSGTQKSLTVTGSGTNQVIKVGYADGGFTGRGNKYDAAGIVHRGEYVIPKEQVNQSTGLPKDGALGGNTNVTVNVSMSGIMTSSKADERTIANRMAALINETVKSKTGRPAIAGI